MERKRRDPDRAAASSSPASPSSSAGSANNAVPTPSAAHADDGLRDRLISWLELDVPEDGAQGDSRTALRTLALEALRRLVDETPEEELRARFQLVLREHERPNAPTGPASWDDPAAVESSRAALRKMGTPDLKPSGRRRRMKIADVTRERMLALESAAVRSHAPGEESRRRLALAGLLAAVRGGGPLAGQALHTLATIISQLVREGRLVSACFGDTQLVLALLGFESEAEVQRIVLALLADAPPPLVALDRDCSVAVDTKPRTKSVTLTEREYTLLLALRPDRAMTDKELSIVLGCKHNVIRAHVLRIRTALAQLTPAECVRTEPGKLGYRLTTTVRRVTRNDSSNGI